MLGRHKILVPWTRQLVLQSDSICCFSAETAWRSGSSTSAALFSLHGF